MAEEHVGIVPGREERLEAIGPGVEFRLGVVVAPEAQVEVGTGPLLLSFDSEAARDRAVAELLDETGLTAGDGGSAHA